MYSLTFLLICLQCLRAVVAQARYYTTDAPSAPTTANFVRRGYHASIALGNYLYIDGGDLWQVVDGNFFYAPNNDTLSIDLSKPWTNSSITFNTINKTAQGVPQWNSENLWPDPSGESFYQWDGEWSYLRLNYGTPQSILYQFTPDGKGGGSWTPPGTSSSSVGLFPNLQRRVGAATAVAGDTWYAVGGYTSCHSDPNIYDCSVVTGLGPVIISYNSSSSLWTNASAEALTGTGSSVWAQSQNVPFGGSDGVNLIFGGGIAPENSGSPNDPVVLGFDHIYMYDPASKNFLNQTASESTSGSLPQPRNELCSVGAPGSNGTYEIFIYGGANSAWSDDTALEQSDEVFILSLPGFVWFKVDVPHTGGPRAQHTCNLIGKSQMVVVGGIDPTIDLQFANQTDPWANGINIFDMNALQWKTEYDPSAPAYKTPTIVTDWYKKNGKYPSTWDYAAVQSLFEKAPAKTSSPSGPTQSSTPSGHHSSHTGAIVGGIVGGLVLLAAVALIAFCVLRSRSRRRQATYQKADLSTAGTADQPAESKLRPTWEAANTPVHEMYSDYQGHEVDAHNLRQEYELSASPQHQKAPHENRDLL